MTEPKETLPSEWAALEWLERAWTAIGLYGRLGLIAAVVLLVGWQVVRALIRLGQSRRRGLLLGLTAFFLIAALGLGTWVRFLPAPEVGYFVLWHQVVRVGAALSGTAFLVCFMVAAIPWAFNWVEQQGFTNLMAARHVRSNKSGFLTVISVLSIAGVAVSSFALCIVVSIMGGFGADLKRKILGNNAHIRIEAKGKAGFDHWHSVLEAVRLVPGVKAATPVAAGEAMASSSSNTAGAIVRGVDPETIGTVIDLLSNIQVGKFEYMVEPRKLLELPPETPIGLGPGGEQYLKGPDLKPTGSDLDPSVKEAILPEDVYPAVILGKEIAKTLHLYVGDEITLVSPLGDLGPMGVMPRSRRFRVAAIFYSGMYEYDAAFVYMPLEVSQQFLDLKHLISAIEVKVEDAERVAEVRQRVASAIARPDLWVRDWKELNKNLFSALALEKVAAFMILSIAIAVASFCIICTLLLMVTEKAKEIAILKALGASDRAILRIFMTEGVMIGAIGTIMGVATGLTVVLLLLWFGVRLDPEVYYVDRLPLLVDWVDYVLVAVSALVITTIATIYPALAASRLRPVDGIRYE